MIDLTASADSDALDVAGVDGLSLRVGAGQAHPPDNLLPTGQGSVQAFFAAVNAGAPLHLGVAGPVVAFTGPFDLNLSAC